MTKYSSLLFLLFNLFLSSEIKAQKLFTKLESDESGILFNNIIEDTRESSILLYSNFYGGAGVGIADLDNDGLQDIFFPGNLVADKLYKNQGNLKFTDVTNSAGIIQDNSWASSVIFGDINNDGLLDIYVTCELYDDDTERRKNKLYINKGNFQFEEQAASYGIDDAERSRGASFIDFDKDGWLDLFVLNQPPNPGNYNSYSGQDLLRPEWRSRLYRNNGKGYFNEVGIKAGVGTPSYPNSVVAADLNHDGWQDLYVTNDYEAPDFFYLNNQDGTFTNILDQSMKHISYFAMGVDAADINNDGLLDLMTLDMVAEDNYRLKRNMSGMQPDLFWKLVDQGAHYQYMFNALHLNQGKDHFSDIAQLAGVSSTDWSWSNLIADFDNDGLKDFYITNGLLRDIRNTDMKKTFTTYVEKTIQDFIAENPNAGEVDILDILDIQEGMALHPSVPLNNYAYQNLGALEFENKTKEWGLDIPSFSNGSAYGDLDNDGDLDIVVSNINNEAFVFRNNTDKKSQFLRIKFIDKENKPLQGTKVKIFTKDGIQYSELLNGRGMYSCSENIIHFGLSNNSMVDSMLIYWNDGSKSKKVNVTANQEISISKNNEVSLEKKEIIADPIFREIYPDKINFTHIENIFDDYEKQILLPHKMSQLGPTASVGDINGDGLDDIFLGGARGQMSQVYLQTTDGGFIARDQEFNSHSAFEDIASCFFDVDGDGDLDLYVVSGGNSLPQRNKNYLDRIYINDGKGNLKYAPERLPRILESGSCAVPFDFDNDGDLDLFIGGRHQPWDYPSPSISRLLKNNNGSFDDITKTHANELINIGMVTDAVANDYNQDGKIDLILVGEWMPITFLKNNGKSFVKEKIDIYGSEGEMKTEGWWNTIHATDLNGDGDTDFILGNLGKNYKYKANQSEPFTVHYHDFDSNGQKDIVLSYYNFGEQYPLRGRSCSAQQIPNLKKEFPSYDLFAESDLSSVYGSEALDDALEYKAHMFENIILFAEADNRYKLEALPNSAQISCINSILELDLENDGQSELLLAGNMYQAEVETPRNDGSVGSILKKVEENWINLPNKSHQLYLPYDVRQIHHLKIGNRDCLLVISNNDKVRIFEIRN